MKKLAFTFIIALSAAAVFAHDHGKSCDMKSNKGQAISATGVVTCKGDDDCTFRTTDTRTTYTVCEMSKADLPKLSASGKTVTVKGKLIACEGKEKLLISKVGK